MKILRCKYKNKNYWGILNEKQIEILQKTPFDDIVSTEKKISINDVEFLPPVNPPNIFAIGLNYKSHADESEMEYPDRPVIFAKTTNSVIGPGDKIVLPSIAPDEVDYEAELVIVIGKKCKKVSKEDAFDYVLGYTCANDVSARDCQIKQDTQWVRAKSFDTFCPLGPVIETELDPDNADIQLRLNGNIMQQANTRDMLFPCAELVSYLSQAITLYPGTVILTGTPPGVGFARKPPVFLKPGDHIKVEVEGIGVLENTVIKE